MEKDIALLLICTGEQYHQFIGPFLESAEKHFLPHDTILWTDYGGKLPVTHKIETEHMPRPYPTLMRYHYFLGQKDILKEYDFLYYCDIDMKFVGDVMEEVLTDNGLMATRHPGYVFRHDFEVPEPMKPPFEPNPKSAAYCPQGKNYYAGGFQGGRSEPFIWAMEKMRDAIDADFRINYRARWNDESHWNKYLFDNPPEVVLNPSYCYPEPPSDGFYKKFWPEEYVPKLIAITKKFDMTKEGGKGMTDLLSQIK